MTPAQALRQLLFRSLFDNVDIRFQDAMTFGILISDIVQLHGESHRNSSFGDCPRKQNGNLELVSSFPLHSGFRFMASERRLRFVTNQEVS